MGQCFGSCFGKKSAGASAGGYNAANANKYQAAPSPDPETVRQNALAAAERRLKEQNLRGVQGNKATLPQTPVSPAPGRNQTELSDARAWN